MTTSAAYPWRTSGMDEEGETAPGGYTSYSQNASYTQSMSYTKVTSSSGGGAKDLSAEYGKLKEAGMPLDSMKLVLNEDLSALNEDASHVLSLNERLSRYALYVSNLERANKELGVRVESYMSEVAAMRQMHQEEQAEWAAERQDFIAKVAAAEAQHQDALLRADAAETAVASAKEAVAAADDRTKQEAAKNATLEAATEELRTVMKDNGVTVPKHLNPGALKAAGKRQAFGDKHGAAAERMLDAAVANSDSARVALRVAALQAKGAEPPVDENVMEEMLSEGLSPQELKGLLGRVREMSEALKVALSSSELKALYAKDMELRRQRLEAKGIALPAGAA